MKKAIFLILILFICGCNKEKIHLPHGYMWKTTTPNQSDIITPLGQTILSGHLSLWSKYPFIYGNGDKSNKEFVLNLQTGEIIFFESSQDFSLFLEKKNLPKFYTSVSDSHQTTINNIIHLRDAKSEVFIKNIKIPEPY